MNKDLNQLINFKGKKVSHILVSFVLKIISETFCLLKIIWRIFVQYLVL